MFSVCYSALSPRKAETLLDRLEVRNDNTQPGFCQVLPGPPAAIRRRRSQPDCDPQVARGPEPRLEKARQLLQ